MVKELFRNLLVPAALITAVLFVLMLLFWAYAYNIKKHNQEIEEPAPVEQPIEDQSLKMAGR